MKIAVLGTTHPGYTATKEEFENFSGHAAGVCYMPGSFESLMNEPLDKTQRRIAMTKGNYHHSVFGHDEINLELEDIPKALAMVINNEHEYTTSEKSARYTKMVLSEDEQKLYDKWCENFQDLITAKYKNEYPDWFSDSKIKKLAQENARYLISVFTPTTLIYTTSYRQLNVLYGLMQKEIENPNSNRFYEMLKPAMKDFCNAIENLPYFDETLANVGRLRRLSLVAPNREFIEHFGSVYSARYKASFAELAQAQRHRTLDYEFTLLENDEFYAPPILKLSEYYAKAWLKDCEKVAKNFPQGLLLNVHEMGKLDDFILKMYERRCSAAQLEIADQTKETYEKYYNALKEQGSDLAKELEPFKHARCTYPEFICTQPCGFKDGVLEEREI
ncbi:MAG: FAD-dependent thymidylate synthase [Clostridia bacterium]|nr:FAD-dependent thymidylate synthase [Clostridia bacterium]